MKTFEFVTRSPPPLTGEQSRFSIALHARNFAGRFALSQPTIAFRNRPAGLGGVLRIVRPDFNVVRAGSFGQPGRRIAVSRVLFLGRGVRRPGAIDDRLSARPVDGRLCLGRLRATDATLAAKRFADIRGHRRNARLAAPARRLEARPLPPLPCFVGWVKPTRGGQNSPRYLVPKLRLETHSPEAPLPVFRRSTRMQECQLLNRQNSASSSAETSSSAAKLPELPANSACASNSSTRSSAWSNGPPLRGAPSSSSISSCSRFRCEISSTRWTQPRVRRSSHSVPTFTPHCSTKRERPAATT